MDTDDLGLNLLERASSVGPSVRQGRPHCPVACCSFSPYLYCLGRGKVGQLFALLSQADCREVPRQIRGRTAPGMKIRPSVCMPTPRVQLPSRFSGHIQGIKPLFLGCISHLLLFVCFIFCFLCSTLFSNYSRSQTDGLISLAKMKFKNHPK